MKHSETNAPKRLRIPVRQGSGDRRARAKRIAEAISEMEYFGAIDGNAVYKIVYFALFMNGLTDD